MIGNKQVVVDPSLGWYSGKSILELENQSDFVLSEHKKLNQPGVAPEIAPFYYDNIKNITLESIEDYHPKMASLEYALDYLKFILPLILMAFSGVFLRFLVRKA